MIGMAKRAGSGNPERKASQNARRKPSAKDRSKARSKTRPELSPQAMATFSVLGTLSIQFFLLSHQPPSPARRLHSRAVNWARSRLTQTLIMSAIALVVGWLVNVYLMAIRYEGFLVPAGAPTPGRSNLVSGSLYWVIASSIVFGVIGYRMSVGKERFWSEIRSIPDQIGSAFRLDGERNLVHLLLGFAVSMLIIQIVSPSLSGTLAVGVLVFFPTPLRGLLVGFLVRAIRFLLSKVSPESTGRATLLATTVGLIGGAAAMTVGYLVASRNLRLTLAIGAAIAAIVVGKTRRSVGAATLLLLVPLLVLAAAPALADDGGWAESGSSLTSWLAAGGAGEIMGRAMFAALAAAGGAAAGFAFGGGAGGASGSGEGGGGPGVKVDLTFPTDLRDSFMTFGIPPEHRQAYLDRLQEFTERYLKDHPVTTEFGIVPPPDFMEGLKEIEKDFPRDASGALTAEIGAWGWAGEKGDSALPQWLPGDPIPFPFAAPPSGERPAHIAAEHWDQYRREFEEALPAYSRKFMMNSVMTVGLPDEYKEAYVDRVQEFNERYLREHPGTGFGVVLPPDYMEGMREIEKDFPRDLSGFIGSPIP